MQQHQQQQQQQERQWQEPVDIFLTHVPANLRAKFGRARCRELLADQAEVLRVWSTLSCHGDQREEQQQQNRKPPQRLPPLEHQEQDWYSLLSEQFNSDYSPGVTVCRPLGHSRETHGESVFGRSGEFNAAGARHKRQRDDFVVYNEIVHVDRKFNGQWASREDQPARRVRQQQPAAPPRQPPPVSILTSGVGPAAGAAGGKSRPTAKRVTISEEQPQPQALHRANTVQRET